MIDEPTKTPHEGAGTDSFQILDRFGPVKSPARRCQNSGSFTHAASKVRPVDTVDRGLFSVGNYDFVAKHIEWLESEKLVCRWIDNSYTGLANFAWSQSQRRRHENYVAVLCRHPVIGRGGTETDVIRI